MRWARFRSGGTVRYGIVEGDRLATVEGTPFGEWRPSGEVLPLASAALLVPVIPPTFYCVGFNYATHANDYNPAAQRIPARPEVGYRANSALIPPGEAIVIPHDSAGVQFEGELAVVIGKTAKHVSREDALSIVFGYTIGNDVSERTWQRSDRTLWRAKNTDTFKPMGPWIETELDLPSLVTRVTLNGKQVSEFKTNEMIFGVEAYIAEITKYITLRPGDVIWMGTEGPTLDMKGGDVVTIEIDQIGALTNPVVAEAKQEA
jgi:2-keto-4-pentenoate hydratase/2-oxohepta-3-ene-1,7-dioic acid hydratase in catechol pathway